MNALVKLLKVRNDEIHGLRRFYDDIESNIRACHHLELKPAPMAR